jgi:hypothetical protein
VHEFVEKFTNAKAMIRIRMKVYELLTMATPPGLALLIFVMSTFMKTLGLTVAQRRDDRIGGALFSMELWHNLFNLAS